MTRRPSLAAVARSRGYALDISKSGPWWFADTVAPAGAHHASGPMCVCRTRRAAEAGLRAALLALPEKRKDGKR